MKFQPLRQSKAAGHHAALFLLEGACAAGGDGTPPRPAEQAIFERRGAGVAVEAAAASRLLLLAGEGLGEPIAGHGPFVRISRGELDEAMD